MAWWLWFLFGFALLGAEIFTPGAFFVFFFGLGAVIVGVIKLSGVLDSVGLEWVLFAALSLLLLALLRSWLLRLATPPASKMDRDDMVGSLGDAEQNMAPGHTGRIRLRGSEWSAVNTGSQIINTGDRVTVVAVKGLTVEVTKSGSH